MCIRDRPGTVVFLFQPAEEQGPGPVASGAPAMVKAGVLDNPKVDVVMGQHISARAPSGTISYRRGSLMASGDVFKIALPLSGWMHDSAWKDAATHPMQLFGLFEWPRIGWIMDIEAAAKENLHTVLGGVHTWAGYVLYGLFALHLIGALKHQFLDGEAELQRMLP